jgi:hypothetical protein
MGKASMLRTVAIVAMLAFVGSAYAEKIMIFGGQGHKTYLGCLSCSKFAYDSVFNKFGPHGNQFSSESIYNHFSDYGSKFSNYSACNQYASDPPVVVDDTGSFYGRLTIASRPDAIKSERVIGWLIAVCEG